MDARQVVIKPIVSEKSYGLFDQGVYTFEVHPEANKIQIRQAVEEMFSVQVKRVNTLNRQGKTKQRRTRRSITMGKRADTKRAIVTLKGDDRIDLFEQA
jgi:large subunit ribosomal protein L23